MLPLPVGTEKLCNVPWLGTTLTAAYPSRTMWTWNMGWAGEVVSIGELDCEVYHVPQPAPADKPTILPPAEMPEALRPYWTPESRVWMSRDRSLVQINPCGKWYGFETKKVHNAYQNPVPGDSTMLAFGYTLLPNRTVTTESILGTASAAKAVEQGVADAVEGRTVEVPAVRLVVDKTDERVVSKPDPLDQLAAEAQAEGEYGTDRMTMEVKPPKEIEQYAEVLGWTPESKVWRSSYGTIRVNPSGKALDDGGYIWNHPESDEKCEKSGDTLLPNQTPTPRRTAREVAEEAIVNRERHPGGDRSKHEIMVDSIAAAIERDRQQRPEVRDKAP